MGISHKGQTGQYSTRVAVGEEREHYWQMAASIYPGYTLYKQKAGDRQSRLWYLSR